MRVSGRWLEDEDGTLYNLNNVVSISINLKMGFDGSEKYGISIEHIGDVYSTLCKKYDTRKAAELALDDLRIKIISYGR